MLLAATGRLDGRKATTNKRLYDEITPKYPGVQWQKRAHWVQDGKFLTSSGVTAGIDAAFAFLSNTCVAPEDREVNSALRKASAKGDATAVLGFNKEKTL
ncbi:hypothetical protein MMC11_006150 [Xylographa trunciseda]|nr:hypothetical protein [Xylographa trunciseda]